MSPADEETPMALPRLAGEFRNSGLELLVVGPKGVLRFPLCQESVRLGGSEADIPLGDQSTRLFFHADQLYFEDAAGRRPVSLDQEWELGPYRMRVQPEEAPGALLEGLSEPGLGRFWSLGRQVFLLGRPGKRSNDLCLENASLSRQHARILALPEGYLLQVETARSLTELNGQPLKLSDTAWLREGDVLQLGQVRLRFRLHATPPARELRIFALGAFEVFTSRGKLSQADWKHRMACHLLARVAAAGGLVALERLLEDFWPEKDPANARRRLTWHLCALRTQLGDDWVVRSQYGLQLKDGVWHDVLELDRALRMEDVARALQLYRGPYLDDCYLEWAQQLRRDLDTRFLGLLVAALDRIVDPHMVKSVCQALLSRDPACQKAYAHSMRADLTLGMPQQALKTFQEARLKLRGEWGIEPGVELLREQQRAKLLL